MHQRVRGSDVPQISVIPSPPGRGRGDPVLLSAKLTIHFQEASIMKMNKENLKNLLNCPGSPRGAFSAPRDDGMVGMISSAFLWMTGMGRRPWV